MVFIYHIPRVLDVIVFLEERGLKSFFQGLPQQSAVENDEEFHVNVDVLLLRKITVGALGWLSPLS